jgi:hypothetical protein
MRKFQTGHQLADIVWPDITSDAILQSVLVKKEGRGTIAAVGRDIEMHSLLSSTADCRTVDYSASNVSSDLFQFPDHRIFRYFDGNYYQWLLDVYALLFGENHALNISHRVEVINSVVYNGECFPGRQA